MLLKHLLEVGLSKQAIAARFAMCVDRRFSVLDRDLYAVIEYQPDPFGAARASDLSAVEYSRPAAQREMQRFGCDEAAVQLQYRVHPLVSAESTGFWNLRDGSASLAPDAIV
ncbi:MAG: hypothetical protein KGL93_07785 [Gemmatimonadota bacterium]|nr:hypothetical protein [Gemmatimonadota bacterium]